MVWRYRLAGTAINSVRAYYMNRAVLYRFL